MLCLSGSKSEGSGMKADIGEREEICRLEWSPFSRKREERQNYTRGPAPLNLCRLLVDRHALPEHPLHLTLDGGEASETTGPPNKDSQPLFFLQAVREG